MPAATVATVKSTRRRRTPRRIIRPPWWEGEQTDVNLRGDQIHPSVRRTSALANAQLIRVVADAADRASRAQPALPPSQPATLALAQPASVATNAPKKPITDSPTPTQPQIIPAFAIPDPDVAPAARRIIRRGRPAECDGRGAEQDRQDGERPRDQGSPAVGGATQTETDHAERDQDRRDAGDQRADRETGCDRRHTDVGVRERGATDRLEPVDAGQPWHRHLTRRRRSVATAVTGSRIPRAGVAGRRISLRRISRRGGSGGGYPLAA